MMTMLQVYAIGVYTSSVKRSDIFWPEVEVFVKLHGAMGAGASG